MISVGSYCDSFSCLLRPERPAATAECLILLILSLQELVFLLGIIFSAGSGYPEVAGAKELMNLENFPDNTSGPLTYILEHEV